VDIVIAARIIRFCTGAIFVWGVFYLSFRQFLLDNLRQNLFQIRDDVFDFAADGGIEFSDFCYRSLRDDINSLLLFADKLSFGRLIFAQVALKRNPEITSQIELWFKKIDHLSPLARKTLSEARLRVWWEIVYYMINRSIILFLFFHILRLISLWVNKPRNLYQSLPNFAKPLEAQAHDEYHLAA
jgi:hypothetical protein